ncbi:hypothetical protein CH338_18265, partial [Rhodoplanes elegans]
VSSISPGSGLPWSMCSVPPFISVTPQSDAPAGEGPATRAEWRCNTPDKAADRAVPEPAEPPVAAAGAPRAVRPARAAGAPVRPRPRTPALRPPEPRKPVFETPLD